MSARRIGGVAVALVVLAGSACGRGGEEASRQPSVDDGTRVASFDFRESTLLAELYAQMIESVGVPVVRVGAIGPREIAMPALEEGLVDLVPEYLGTALRWFGATEPIPDRDAGLAELRDRLGPIGLTALDAAPAEDVNVFAVARDAAQRHRLVTLSDLVPVAPGMRLGGPPECPDRPLCLEGLEATYGLRFGEFVAQRSQPFTAEAIIRGEIDVGVLFSTDPVVSMPGLVVLEDDRDLQPPENVVPVVRTEALERWGSDVATALDRMSRELTTTTLRLLNRLVDDGSTVEAVAANWLRSEGLLDPG